MHTLRRARPGRRAARDPEAAWLLPLSPGHRALRGAQEPLPKAEEKNETPQTLAYIVERRGRGYDFWINNYSWSPLCFFLKTTLLAKDVNKNSRLYC